MALVVAAQAGDTDAMAMLANDNLALVQAAAGRFSGVDKQELFQAGCLGLVEAIRRFDVSRGVRFSTYAVPYILGEMKRFVREDRVLRIPRSLYQTAQNARRTAEILRLRLGREPTLQEIAQEIDISPEDLALALDSRKDALSLDMPLGDEGSASLQDTLDDNRQQEALDQVLVREMLERCSQRERTLLLLRYYRGLSQEDTARVLGISQSRVSRLEKQTLVRLKESGVG